MLSQIEYFVRTCIFVVEKLTTGRFFRFSTIINDTSLHIYSTLHRHMSGRNAAEHLKAVIPPSLVLNLHITDTSSKIFYPAQQWQATWQTFHQNILCTWQGISQLTAHSGKSDITWCILRTKPNWWRVLMADQCFCAVWLQYLSLRTRKPKARLPVLLSHSLTSADKAFQHRRSPLTSVLR